MGGQAITRSEALDLVELIKSVQHIFVKFWLMLWHGDIEDICLLLSIFNFVAFQTIVWGY